MPIVAFDLLPSDARVWVFAADQPIADPGAQTLLTAVDAFLAQWNAHGDALRCARAWRDERFLAIGVDQATAGASGCSIDGLFRTLQGLQPALGASLLPAGRVYWRDDTGAVQTAARADFARLAKTGAIRGSTPVFDTAVTTAKEWRDEFERPAQESWHAALLVPA